MTQESSSTLPLSSQDAIRLWDQFRVGNAPTSLEAMDKLYVTYFDAVRRYCGARLRDTHRASEIAQEVFVRILRLENKPVIRSSVKGLLLRTAHNLCLAELAKPQLKLEQAASVDDPPDRHATHDEELTALDECMDRLDQPERAIVALHHGDGLPYREIREILGIRLSFAGFTRRIGKALAALRRCLREKRIF